MKHERILYILIICAAIVVLILSAMVVQLEFSPTDAVANE
ncbi:hypothetical protein FLAV_02364 [Flavobacteriales bacterium]|nr:hypothetical protein [Flavobacteriales bacterium]CAG0992100.1 hypothetical protein FLAV_02364 [Flavobacteriales bacterium]